MQNYNLLKNNSLKVTPQRLDIIKLFKENGHLTVEQLFKKLQCIHKNISLATIYKNINYFLYATLLLEVTLNNQKVYYELTKDKHSHLLCKKCLTLPNKTVIDNNSF